MNQKTTTFGIAVISIVATGFLVLLSGIIPALSAFFMLFASVTVAYCYMRCGFVATVFNILISSLLSLLIGGFEISVLVLPAMGLFPGIVSGVMQKRRIDYYTSLSAVIFSFLAVFVLSVYMAGLMTGGIGGMFDAAGEVAKLSVGSMITGNTPVSVDEINYVIDTTTSYAKMVFPSMMIIFSMFAGYIHMALTRYIMKKFSNEMLNYVFFDMNCAPKSMSYLYFAASVIVLFSSNDGTLVAILNNVVMVLDTILAFCGLSFIESKFKNMVKYSFLRWIIYILAILFSGNIAVQVLSIVGMVDSFADYRRIRRIGE